MTPQLAGIPPVPTDVKTLVGPTKWPSTKRQRRRFGLVLAILILIGLVAVVVSVIARSRGAARIDLVKYKVQAQRLELTVVERGTLESANNCDVYCRVKSFGKNTTIKSVINDGSLVHKGDLLVELDDSALIDQLTSEKITLDLNESAKIQAEQQFEITVSQNKGDIQSAEVTLDLARLNLQKYLEGDYPQSLKDVDGRIKTAESNLEQQRDRAAWAQRMLKKGYLTVSQAQSEQSQLESLTIALDKVKEEKRVLINPIFGLKKLTESDLLNKVTEAERALSRTKSQAFFKEVAARADREFKRSIYQRELGRYHDIEEEIKKCKIHAPQDGMVVYFVPEQARSGGGAQQSIVAQGEPVREGQILMQIPDLHHMLVYTRIHEAMVSRVKRYQSAAVRVDAFPDRQYHARVDSVATISAQQDFWAPDVKVYITKVALEGVMEDLKPGMSAEVKITVGEPLERALTVPIEAIVGSAELGSHRHCFVQTPNGPEERDIVVGISNERLAEIQQGLQEGDEVVLNPKALVESNKDAPAREHLRE